MLFSWCFSQFLDYRDAVGWVDSISSQPIIMDAKKEPDLNE
jgi:hypothetical protein